MEPLKETCGELEKVLIYIENDCQTILASLNEFDCYVGSYAVAGLARKLQILSYWIIVLAEALHKEHKGQGYVCVFLTESEGITVHWVKTEKIVSDRAWYQSHGSTVLSVEEAIELIIQMINHLASTNWEKVVDWVKKYGRSPGLDFNKFL